ncbi:hypothetical protein N0V88_003769 [Collariella sp. IMI 366227]|nr:hypothetical protein N0V88_003769 [Collariella sp. IMI 366227]
MASKRDYSAVATDEHDEPAIQSSNKRRREQQNSKSKGAEGKPDPTYGQRCAFPGLDDDESVQITDDDLEFEESGDALAYLRAVRQEASSVPHVLVAPKAGPQLPPHLQQQTASDTDRSIYTDGVGDSRGYYHDGAYTAAPDPDPSTISSENDFTPDDPDLIATQSSHLRKAYYASLTSQFLSLRALLHQTPPCHLVAALPRDNGTEVGSFGARSWTFRVWTKRIRHTDPLPVQVAALDRQSVLKLLRVILGGKFIRRGYELRERTSRWVWALLARLPDRGEMGYDEVGWVRELGKRAVLMMVSIGQMEALREEVEGENLEGEEVDGDDGEEGYAGEMAGDGEVEIEGDGEPATEQTAAGIKDANDDENGEMDMDLDDGEVSDDNIPTTAGNQDIQANIAAAKARLLARLAEATSQEEQVPPPATEDQQNVNDSEAGSVFDETAARVNMRATLNMILTVAGKFYGQRDLLEFRDPFPAL